MPGRHQTKLGSATRFELNNERNHGTENSDENSIMIFIKKALRRVRSYTRKGLQLLEPLASLSGFTSALYYLLFSSSFRREQQAVLKGKIAYRYSLHRPGECSYLLRRNVHRLEKALIMEPRRPVFAREYIGETVAAFESAVATIEEHAQSTELHWARGVLDEYFAVVSAEGDFRIGQARDQYARGVQNLRGLTGGPKPYPAETLDAKPVTPDQFADLCRVRRSVRWYDGRKVPRDAIDRALTAAATAPSACNRQALRYLIFDEPGLLSRIAAIPMGTRGFSENFPALAVLVGDLGAYFDERDRHVIYIDGSLSAMTFMFALQTQGLASCSINWPDMKDKEAALRNELALEKNERVIMLISFGYARAGGGRSRLREETSSSDSILQSDADELGYLARICPEAGGAA